MRVNCTAFFCSALVMAVCAAIAGAICSPASELQSSSTNGFSTAYSEPEPKSGRTCAKSSGPVCDRLCCRGFASDICTCHKPESNTWAKCKDVRSDRLQDRRQGKGDVCVLDRFAHIPLIAVLRARAVPPPSPLRTRGPPHTLCQRNAAPPLIVLCCCHAI